MNKKPSIQNISTIAQSRLFSIEELKLAFSNGEQRNYERIIAPGNGAVMIIPLLDSSSVLMIREYCAGTDRYELLFPKGLIENDEALLDAANRELMEEVGMAARKLEQLTPMTIAPGYLGFTTYTVLAEGLYEQQLEGDEPEQAEVVPCDISDIDQLLYHPELTEARSIAALYMTRDIINKRQQHD